MKNKLVKKIGVLTHPLRSNYGGVLQAVALFCFLKKQNYDVAIIDKIPCHSLFKRMVLWCLGWLPFQNIKGVRFGYKQTKLNNKELLSVITKTAAAVTTEEMRFICVDEGFDAVIVGSDQVWRMDYINDGYFANYFLDFVGDDVRKISYAASFGLDHWQAPDRALEVSQYLERFHAVSVRESSGVDICKDTFGREDCVHVLDPTLLFDSGFYSKQFNLVAEDGCGRNITTYMLDWSEGKSLFVSRFSERTEGYRVRDILSKKKRATRSISDWLGSFKNSDFILTDSFHGMVFAIIFKKEFYVVVNAERGAARFLSLLNLLGLSDRMIYDVDKFDFSSVSKSKINYEVVDRKLKSLRDLSEKFLLDSLR